jgi:hypothetical protein
MLSVSDILTLLSQVTWPGFASGVTTTVGVGGLWIAWRRYRHDRQRPAPVFEVTAVPIQGWPMWQAVHITVRNAGPAAAIITGTHPGRLRRHFVAPIDRLQRPNSYGTPTLPPSPPTELPAVQVMEIHVRPDRSRPLRLALAVGPRSPGGHPPRSLLLFWEWADERTRTHQTRIRF